MLGQTARLLQRSTSGSLAAVELVLRTTVTSGREATHLAVHNTHAIAFLTLLCHSDGAAHARAPAAYEVPQLVQLHLFGTDSDRCSRSNQSFEACRGVPAPVRTSPRSQSMPEALSFNQRATCGRWNQTHAPAAMTKATADSVRCHSTSRPARQWYGNSISDPDYRLSIYGASGTDRRRNGTSEADVDEVVTQLAKIDEDKERDSPQEREMHRQQGQQARCSDPSGYEWRVLEFRASSEEEPPTVRAVTATPESLGLAPRDVSLFAAIAGPGKQRATITARGAELLFRSECCRAVIRSDRAFLFPSRRVADTVGLARALKSNLTRRPKNDGGGANPFEFRVLECLLAATVAFFESKTVRLHLLTHSVLNDIMEAVSQHTKTRGVPKLMTSQVDLKQLLPIQRSLTELTADVKETSEAIKAVSDDDAALAALCLSDRSSAKENRRPMLPQMGDGGRVQQTPAMYRGAGLLESYQRQVQSMDGELRELEENIDTVREVWHMSLDNTRNRTLQLNLMISIASFAAVMSTVPASFFGMNLHSGIEEAPDLLWWVAGGCLALSSATFTAILLSHRLPRKDEQRKVRDLEATRELLHHHLNDMDDIVAALHKHNRPMDRTQFKQLVQEVQHSCSASDRITAAEIDLMFKVFDTNRDGAIDWRDAVRSRKDLVAKEMDGAHKL